MSKERLEEIQKEVNYAYRKDGSINTKAVTMPIEHYEHLYEQTERVQEYEYTQKYEDELIKQNERYREALEEIKEANYWDYGEEFLGVSLQHIARKALEDEK